MLGGVLLVGGGWRKGEKGGGGGAYLVTPVADAGSVEDEFVVGGVLEALFAVPVGGRGGFGLVVWVCVDW